LPGRSRVAIAEAARMYRSHVAIAGEPIGARRCIHRKATGA
jgi:hypothetical protein